MKPLIINFAAALTLTLMSLFGHSFLDPIIEFENQIYVWKIQEPRQPSDEILIIGIEDESAKEILDADDNRILYARALRKLMKLAPDAIGVDVIFEREDDRPGSKLLGFLADKHKNIFFAQDFNLNRAKPIPLFEHLRNSEPSTGIVSIESPRSSIGKTTLPLGIYAEGRWYPSLVSSIYCYARLNQRSGERCLESIAKNAGVRLVTPSFVPSFEPKLNINFVGDYYHFQHISLRDFLESGLDIAVKNKLVLLGSVSSYLRDTIHSPIVFRYHGDSDGIVLIANALNTLVGGETIRVTEFPMMFLCLMSVTMLFIFLCGKVSYKATVGTLAIMLVTLASPVIISPIAMLGFLERGGTDEGQAIYRRTNHPDFA